MNHSETRRESETEFERAGRGQDVGLASEFLAFVIDNKKWWLVPILLALGGLSVLALVAGTGAAPFIYTLF